MNPNLSKYSETSSNRITSRFFFRGRQQPPCPRFSPPPCRWSHTGCCVYPHRPDWHVPCNESAERRDALVVGFHLSSRSLENGTADVMILAPDVKRYMLPRCGATAASGWLSAWLCFRRSARGGDSGLCVCEEAASVIIYDVSLPTAEAFSVNEILVTRIHNSTPTAVIM